MTSHAVESGTENSHQSDDVFGKLSFMTGSGGGCLQHIECSVLMAAEVTDYFRSEANQAILMNKSKGTDFATENELKQSPKSRLFAVEPGTNIREDFIAPRAL